MMFSFEIFHFSVITHFLIITHGGVCVCVCTILKDIFENNSRELFPFLMTSP